MQPCCACCPNRVGAAIIGVFNLIVSLVLIFLVIINDIRNTDDNGEYYSSILQDPYNNTLIVLIVVLVVSLLASLSLLLGTVIQSKPLVLIWILWAIIALIICIVSCVIILMHYSIETLLESGSGRWFESKDGTELLAYIFLYTIVNLVLVIYELCVVYAYYYDLILI